MLQDVSDAQERTAAALDTARDFAAASAHELRTPLTAMRTDLEVLTTLDLSDEQRAEILADLARTQGRLEARSPRWNGSRRVNCPARRTTSTST